MRLVTTALLLSVLSGCVVVKVPQYEAAKGFVGQFWARGSAQDEVAVNKKALIGEPRNQSTTTIFTGSSTKLGIANNPARAKTSMAEKRVLEPKVPRISSKKPCDAD